MSRLLQRRVLVLNKYYMAMRIVSARRAFCLLYKNYAEVVEKEDGHFSNYDFWAWVKRSQSLGENGVGASYVRTPTLKIAVPRVIRLQDCTRPPRQDLKFTRKNILARDGNRCQYCGRKFPVSKLSLDHVVPRSRGGRTTWTNVVTACAECNSRKGGRLPDEVGMKLIRPPRAPRRPILVESEGIPKGYEIWADFMAMEEAHQEAVRQRR
jgi:5-methylcytosine-specific restriction endonuclease McrA